MAEETTADYLDLRLLTLQSNPISERYQQIFQPTLLEPSSHYGSKGPTAWPVHLSLWSQEEKSELPSIHERRGSFGILTSGSTKHVVYERENGTMAIATFPVPSLEESPPN
ncbi:hypothetical protein I7I51_09012 [Histoplasma capsulatum]|uniref:Uncharacterized protein n=1 Tax=Ajellomyces capsulatus TaxID=5037 RepID=A0A8A1LZG6_AJECA|nr:hypothetical protein I7I51_09012 [Histoplasma capsulatum]